MYRMIHPEEAKTKGKGREKRKPEKEIFRPYRPSVGHTCSLESVQQQVQKLFVNTLVNVDLWGKQDCSSVRH